MFRLTKQQAFKKLFLDGGNKLKPEAETVLEELCHFAHFWQDMGPEPYALAMQEGRRQTVRRIFKFLKISNTKKIIANNLKGEDYDF